MIDDLLRPAVAPEKKLQPPARWRNWHRTKIRAEAICEECGGVRKLAAGEMFATCCVFYPSKEVAEIDARRYQPNGLADYVGAYREGERP